MRAAQPGPITPARKALRVKEAAQVLGTSPASVWKLIYSPESDFPSLKINSTVVIPVKALDEWIERHTRPNGQERGEATA
jgi:predicted DNA-binding transcriptional regulator AlpA